ncbi:uncharacterized protein LOC117651984 [Thrips palmi]|uniref:Uncharacterized protein LOC117651984 n=1 Tax=Thrips palmi TaxID=161013 RepID=A0A6P9A876_THRPL|nr:uncharacterized protein LOC117651984 [Thrips palmi]
MGTQKKIQISFELTTEKEWREFIHRPGLIVVDLYRDWAGPCVAMGTPLKNLKTSEAAFQWMQLASAPSSIVPDLRRLQGSRPTFVLLSGGRLVNVIFGCRAPEVIRIIQEEIEREKRAAEGLEKRKTVSLTRLSPAEVAMEEGMMGTEGARLRAELDEAQLKADRVLRRILGQIAEHLPNTTIVVVFPYALQSETCKEIVDALRESWAQQGIAVTREDEVELGPDAVNLMFWERRLPQHDVLADSVTQGPSLVLMLERAAEEAEEEAEDEEEEEAASALNVETAVAKSIYGFLPGTGSSMELITPVESLSPAGEEEEEDTVLPDEGAENAENAEADAEEDEGKGQEEEAVEEGDQAAETEEVEGTEREEANEDEQEDEGEGEGEADPAAGQGTVEVPDRDEEECEDEGWEDGEEEEDEDDLIPQPEVRVWNPRELLPALDSAAAKLLFRRDEKGPVLPGIWTPLTALSKAAAVKALFEDVAEPLFDPPTPPPPPPPESTVICFSGDKRDEVLQLSEAFPSDVTRCGFFTKGRKLLASSRPDYEKLVRGGLQTAKTLVVLEVTRTRATPGIAKADVEEFFGAKCVHANKDDLQEIVKAHEEEEEEYVVPAKRPRPVPEDADAAGPATDAEQPPEAEQAPIVGEVLPEAGEGLGVGPDAGPDGAGEGEVVLEAMNDLPVEDVASARGPPPSSPTTSAS